MSALPLTRGNWICEGECQSGLNLARWSNLDATKNPRDKTRPVATGCGLAILAETGLALAFVGFFIGNGLIGTAGVLLLCGGVGFEHAT